MSNNQIDEVAHVANLLIQDIREGRFAPGQRLFESEIMTRFAIKRGTVRKIFNILKEQGIVSIEKYRGASVRKVTRQELSETFEVLETLSLLAVKRIARQADDSRTKQRLNVLLRGAKKFRKQSATTTYIPTFTHENERFWGSLVEFADNSVLSSVRRQLERPLHRLALEGLTITDSIDRDHWISNHEVLIKALLEGDEKFALIHAEQSIKEVREVILSLPNGAFD